MPLLVCRQDRGTEAEAMQHFTESNPQERLIEAAEVATAVSWLCSDGAASVTGQAIAIDGGGTARTGETHANHFVRGLCRRILSLGL